jgi:Glycosyl hydrolases family 25
MNRMLPLFCVATLLLACAHEVDAPSALDLDALPGENDLALVPDPHFAGDPSVGATYALDISFWEGPVSEHEVECFWDSGVRHIVAGTQVEEITRQQLAMATSRGMTVDAYEYLYWDRDMATQVDEAMAITAGFPIERMWLDVEEDPGDLGSAALTAKVREAVDRCREYEAERGLTCGIYTGPGFWRSHMANTTEFSDVPLWYAWYNERRLLSAWQDERFGGWSAPTGKQWAEQVICGYGADKNTMIVERTPDVVVDHAPPPITGTSPPAPTRLWPSLGMRTDLEYIKLMSALVPGATRYQYALERWNGTQWLAYHTWTGVNAFRWVYPSASLRGFVYRFRARAENARGFGEWSAFAHFELGNVTGARPPEAPPPPAEPPPAEPPPEEPPPEEAPPEEPPPVVGAPSALQPDGTTETGASVTLSCAQLAGATHYEFALEYEDGSGAVRPYTTYTRTGPLATFWPQIDDTTYSWRVRAKVDGAWGPWSAAARFEVQ